MSTLSCSLKYSSVNESVLHFHCRLKLLPACFPFAFVQVSLWKESLEGQWVCVSDVYRGQGQETQWCFCHYLVLWSKKKHFRYQEELCTGCKICLTSLYLQCTTQTKFIASKNRFVVFSGEFCCLITCAETGAYLHWIMFPFAQNVHAVVVFECEKSVSV